MLSGVECVRLTKTYRNTIALHETTVTLLPGVTSLLGANGAGKTTLMSIIATLTRPTAGRVKVAGRSLERSGDIETARTMIGYLPQSFELMGGASVTDNVAYSAWAHGVPADDVGRYVARALGDVGLEDRKRARSRTLSGGQRQRLGIACAVAHRPSIILLDEPTVGIDPVQRVGVRRLVATLGKDATVLLSTHLVDDAAELAARTLVLKEGKVVYDGTTQQLADRTDHGTGDRTRALESALMELMQ